MSEETKLRKPRGAVEQTSSFLAKALEPLNTQAIPLLTSPSAPIAVIIPTYFAFS